MGSDHHHRGKRSVWPELVTHVDNIVLVCRPCHDHITMNPLEHVEDGLHLPRTFDNEVKFGLREPDPD